MTHKIFSNTHACGDHFVILLKMVKCALALTTEMQMLKDHFIANKRTLTKQSISLREKTTIGLRAIKAAIEECVGVNKVPVTGFAEHC